MKGTWSFGCSCSTTVEFAIMKDADRMWIECLKCNATKVIQNPRKKVMAS